MCLCHLLVPASGRVVLMGQTLPSLNHCQTCEPNSRMCIERIQRELPHPTLVDQELVRAARNGDVDAAICAIQAGAHLETRNPFTVLHRGDSFTEEDYLCGEGLTPLMHAVQEGHTKCVAVLLMARACVNAEDEDGIRPLHLAAASGDLEMSATLVWACASTDIVDRAGISVLGHLPHEIRIDMEEVRRWTALLNRHTPPKPPMGAIAAACLAMGPEKDAGTASRDECMLKEWPPPETSFHDPAGDQDTIPIDALDYTRTVLESIETFPPDARTMAV